MYIGRRPIEQALDEHIPAQWDLLSHTPIVLVAKTNSGQLISCKYILSPLTGRVWGLDHSCSNELCQAGPGNIKSNLRKWQDNHDFAKFTCNRCQWTSGWLPRPPFLKQVYKGSKVVKYFFHHDFPLSEMEENYSSYSPSMKFAPHL